MNLFHYNIHIDRNASGKNVLHTQIRWRKVLKTSQFWVFSVHVLHSLTSCVNFLSMYCVNNEQMDLDD